MTRAELKEIVTAVIQKLEKSSPSPACGLFWADEPEDEVVPLYSISDEPVMRYAVQEP